MHFVKLLLYLFWYYSSEYQLEQVHCGTPHSRGFLWQSNEKQRLQQKELASSGPLQAAIVIDGEIVALIDWQWLLTAGVKMLKLTPCSAGRSAGCDSDVCPRLEMSRCVECVGDSPSLSWWTAPWHKSAPAMVLH